MTQQNINGATVAENVWEARLKSLAITISLFCIVILFYRNGSFCGGKYTPPPPADNKAIGVPLNKSTQSTAVSDVVTKALAFRALLTATQQATLELTYTNTLARKWSNLPGGVGCRNGIEFGDLNAAQLSAALEVIQAAMGTGATDGYNEFLQLRLAEAYLHANGGGNGYDTTLRWIAFLNTPSATGAWMLQFGGHHYAANIAFNNGHVIGATPFFMGLEPTSFTLNATTYAPLNDEHDALTAMLASLSTSELATAKLTQTFSDCTMVPGESNGGNGTFPATKVGIACSNLTTAQKNLVLAAIQHYVQDIDSTTAAAIMTVYTNEIDGTYIAYTGTGTSGNASSFLNTNSNYVRIDGPTVWIELACQNGVVIPNQIHYHTIWRDHSHDYGVDLTGAPIDTVGAAAVADLRATNSLNIYPNPTTGEITLTLNTAVSNADVVLINVATGQTITAITHWSGSSLGYDASKLPAGLYVLKVKDANTVFTGKFNKL